jgi:alpha-mannosidase
LRLHPDRPDKWDAWDIDRHYRARAIDLDTATRVDASVVAGVGEVRAVREFGRSTLTQTVRLAPGADSVEIALEVDWQERHRLLRMYVPLDVHADRSTAEIQFGHLSRADGGTTTTVGLSVLRAPTFPDPDADRGRHAMRFTVRPGASLQDAAEEGHRLDRAARVVQGGRVVAPLVRCSDPGVRIETIKLAEDGSDDVIVRIYEATGGRRALTLDLDVSASEVIEVDLLEREIEGGRRFADAARIPLILRAFEILTLRCLRGAAVR